MSKRRVACRLATTFSRPTQQLFSSSFRTQPMYFHTTTRLPSANSFRKSVFSSSPTFTPLGRSTSHTYFPKTCRTPQAYLWTQNSAPRFKKGGIFSGALIALIGTTAVILYTDDKKPTENNTTSETKQEQKQGGTLKEWWDSIRAWWDDTTSTIMNTKPHILLPDALPPPMGKKYTMIVAEELLVNNQYQPTSGGFLMKKRPGCEYFLALASKQFEVVIWSSQPLTTSMPYVDKVDPNRRAAGRLFKDSTSVVNGREVKDLSLLNRDLTKVIVLDFDYDNVSHRENVIIIKKYEGADVDAALLELTPFLKTLSWANPEDIRQYVRIFQEKGPGLFKQKYEELEAKMKKKRGY